MSKRMQDHVPCICKEEIQECECDAALWDAICQVYDHVIWIEETEEKE